MTDLVIPRVRALSETWEQEAAQRKLRTPNDPAADALASCASELKQRLEEIARETAYLSVAEYATAEGASAATIRKLCARGLIDGAERDVVGDWKIPRDAKRLDRPREAKAS